MDKRFIICAIIFLTLTVLGVLAYANFEIYPRKIPVYPSRDVIANDYFALERWLAKTGHPVRVLRGRNLSRIVSGAEKTALVQASACDWKNAAGTLLPWIEGGGFLLISLDYAFYSEDLTGFLAGLGIRQGDLADDEEPDLLAAIDDQPEEPPVPDFDRAVHFTVDKTAGGREFFTIKDNAGLVRLARISLGKGALAVIGRPLFMFNDFLDREVNARLAWDVTGARAAGGNPGLLFIRDMRVTRGFLGRIADRGNVLPLAVSALLLVALGFWMVIPVFGLVFSEKRSRARPIRERFLAEIRFLKKYGALASYLEVYVRELKMRGRGMESAVLEIEEIFQSGRPMKYQDIIKHLRKLETLTERL
jgi:hypothetical protein